MTRRLPRFLLPVVAFAMLAGCMLVEDFSAVWDKAETDSCTGRIAESLYYSEFRRDPANKDINALARVLTLDGQHFLMLKVEPTDKGGRMYRFGVVNGIFQRYRVKPVMRKPFEQEYPNAPVSLKHDTITLANLKPAVLSLLGEIAKKPEYWEIEDQTLYNTMLNPACKFEDRDLKAVEEGRKKKKAIP